MSYDHGNYDYTSGGIISKELKELKIPFDNPWNCRDILKRQYAEKLFDEANKDRLYSRNRQIIAYCELAKRGHGGWHFQRKQNTSSFMRRRYKSMANKKTRQYLKEEMYEELREDISGI